ncbi:hypothetical protein ACTTAF_06680 [Rhodobacter capsulatus]|uniref:hypothetical protein n=1 Tax=Rhodobacter capsulatus TaxID=1061 RepID=UPI00103E1CE4|nr:hypothetical protein [Rhodobacter capsulatus]
MESGSGKKKFFKFPSWVLVAYDQRGECLGELGYLAGFALMPVWLSALIQFITGRSLSDFFNGYLYNGEALLISATTIGPMIYLIQREYGKTDSGLSRKFPGSKALTLLITVVCLASAAVLGLKSGKVPPGNSDSTLANASATVSLAPNAIWSVSLAVSIAALAIWIAVTIIKYSLENSAPKVMRRDTEEFVKEW